MNHTNASIAQYATPTPQVSVGPPVHTGASTRLPTTGYDVALPLLLGVLFVIAGVKLRWR